MVYLCVVLPGSPTVGVATATEPVSQVTSPERPCCLPAASGALERNSRSAWYCPNSQGISASIFCMPYMSFSDEYEPDFIYIDIIIVIILQSRGSGELYELIGFPPTPECRMR